MTSVPLAVTVIAVVVAAVVAFVLGRLWDAIVHAWYALTETLSRYLLVGLAGLGAATVIFVAVRWWPGNG